MQNLKDKKQLEVLLVMGMSSNGGYSAAQARVFGVRWPLEKGWLKRIVENWERVSVEQIAEFVKLRDKHLDNYVNN